MRASQVVQWVKNLPAKQEMQVQSLCRENPLKKDSHSNIRAWEIPWTEEPSGATAHGVTDMTELLNSMTFYRDILDTAPTF